MSLRGALALPAMLALAVVLVASSARAQAAPQIQFQTDANTVGLGDEVRVEMKATSSDEMPSDPKLTAAQGFTVRVLGSSPSSMISIVNGARSDQYSLTVDWALQARRVGTFSVGPPSVMVGGVRVLGQPVAIHVVPAGQAPKPAPQQQQPQGFGSPFGFSFSPF